MQLDVGIHKEYRLLVTIGGFHKPLPCELDVTLQTAWRGLLTINSIQSLLPHENAYIICCDVTDAVCEEVTKAAQRVYAGWCGKYRGGIAGL